MVSIAPDIVDGLSAQAVGSADLDRFLTAQHVSYAQALEEIRGGRKTGHWMWYVFPQLRGLGHSDMAEYYGLSGLDEARDYLAHAHLGPRLREAVSLILMQPNICPVQIFGPVDALKLRSCLTLFALADGTARNNLFENALLRLYDGHPDHRTIALLT